MSKLTLSLDITNLSESELANVLGQFPTIGNLWNGTTGSIVNDNGQTIGKWKLSNERNPEYIYEIDDDTITLTTVNPDGTSSAEQATINGDGWHPVTDNDELDHDHLADTDDDGYCSVCGEQ